MIPLSPYGCFQQVCREKIETSIFDSYWRNKVSNFRLWKFEKVGPFCEPKEADVDINTKNKMFSLSDNSGSNETMQKALGSIV